MLSKTLFVSLALAWAAGAAVHETTVHGRKVWVYTPPGFDRNRAAPYDLVVAFDGEEYLETIPLPKMLDRLIGEGKVAPAVAVLVDNGSGAARIADLGNRAQFASFVARELIPWARENWRATADPRRTIATGSSAGGLASAYLALRHSDVVGNVVAQSPAVWRGNEGSNDAPYEWLTAQFRRSPKLPVRFWIEVGAKETGHVLGGAGPVFLEACRRFVDALKAKDYELQYEEIAGAQHEPGHWRDHLPDGLVAIEAQWRR